jgi:hypothetical protein
MLFDKQVSKLESDIRHFEDSKRQFLLDYNLYKLNHTGCINDGDIVLHDLSTLDNDSIGIEEDKDYEKVNGANQDYTSKKFVEEKQKPMNNDNKSSDTLQPVILPGAPFIVYTLQDYDILEDWSIIKMHNNINNGTTNSESKKC